MSARAPLSISLPEIIAEEHRLALTAARDHGRLHEFTTRGLSLIASDNFTIDRSRYIFAACMAAVRKHVILAYLSAVRRHRAQCALNLRIMLEYACVAFFALGEPEEAKVIGSEPDGSPLMQDRTKERAYKWLDKHHAEVSARFKTARDGISKFEAHGGVIGTGAVFDWDRIGGDEFYASFFDEGGFEIVRASLWQIGNFSMGVMGALVAVNRAYGEPLTFHPGIYQRISDYETFDRVISAELVAAGTWPDVQANR